MRKIIKMIVIAIEKYFRCPSAKAGAKKSIDESLDKTLDSFIVLHPNQCFDEKK